MKRKQMERLLDDKSVPNETDRGNLSKIHPALLEH